MTKRNTSPFRHYNFTPICLHVEFVTDFVKAQYIN